MQIRMIVTGLLVTMLCATSHAHGQKATEQFIPLGQSPGVSQKDTSIGEVSAADARARTVTIVDPAGSHTVRVTDRTRIWLDRTKLKQSNRGGDFADLQKGRRVEIKYEDPSRRDVAEWVKVEVDR